MRNDGRRPETPAEEPGVPDDPSATPPPADYTVAVSPRQLAAGFAIVAALLVLLARRRRRPKG